MMTGYESKKAAAQDKLAQESVVERAWFTIDELNAWVDKKLAENPHWVMPKNEPERDEPPPQRPWVELTEKEVDQFHNWKDCTWSTNELVRYVEAKLKERNA